MRAKPQFAVTILEHQKAAAGHTEYVLCTTTCNEQRQEFRRTHRCSEFERLHKEIEPALTGLIAKQFPLAGQKMPRLFHTGGLKRRRMAILEAYTAHAVASAAGGLPPGLATFLGVPADAAAGVDLPNIAGLRIAAQRPATVPTMPQRRSWRGWLGLANDASESSAAAAGVAPLQAGPMIVISAEQEAAASVMLNAVVALDGAIVDGSASELEAALAAATTAGVPADHPVVLAARRRMQQATAPPRPLGVMH